MGQAKLRGTKEQRQHEGISKRIEKEVAALEARQEAFEKLTPEQKVTRIKIAQMLAIANGLMKVKK